MIVGCLYRLDTCDLEAVNRCIVSYVRKVGTEPRTMYVNIGQKALFGGFRCVHVVGMREVSPNHVLLSKDVASQK